MSSSFLREGLQRKAHNEERMRTCSAKPDLKGHAQKKSLEI